ncbi:MAG: glycosyltransferase family 4 protein, partial [Actinomycetota bacterium]|nr:glycosyltransferase family 4 protein [Actinomycetota bacterium]
MRIAVHDYAGHAFTLELSREMASRGHDVLYLHCPDVVGGKGALSIRDDDPPTLVIQAATIRRTFEKYSPVRRYQDERAYGQVAAARIRAFGPRVVVSANTPLLSQARLVAEARRGRRRFVYWWQDSYGIGLRQVVGRRFPALAPLVAVPFEALERWMLGASDHVVAISEALRGQALRWG